MWNAIKSNIIIISRENKKTDLIMAGGRHAAGKVELDSQRDYTRSTKLISHPSIILGPFYIDGL